MLMSSENSSGRTGEVESQWLVCGLATIQLPRCLIRFARTNDGADATRFSGRIGPRWCGSFARREWFGAIDCGSDRGGNRVRRAGRVQGPVLRPVLGTTDGSGEGARLD